MAAHPTFQLTEIDKGERQIFVPTVQVKPVVAILDDDEVARKRMELVHQSSTRCFDLVQAKSIDELWQLLDSGRVHVLLLDRDLGKDIAGDLINGIDFIPEILEAQPHLQILVLTGNDSVSEVVRAMNFGAANFIVKDSPDELILAQVNRAILQAQIKLREIQFEKSAGKDEDSFAGNSRSFKRLRNRLKALAESDRPILLLGESGTGKTTAAKYVHMLRTNASGLKDSPFYSINMANLANSLADRELFGNERGAYTDAKEAKPGIIELANGGTLFLDEIGEASLEIQAKLLKVLEEGTYMRIGGQREKYSRFKLICATNRDLEAMVQKGTFREDLYMRISAFSEKMPALHERSEDVPELVRSLLSKIAKSMNLSVSYEDLPTEFIEYLQKNPIPGNIRGLDHYLVRLLTLSPRAKGLPIFTNWKRLLFPKVRSFDRVGATEIRIKVDPTMTAKISFRSLVREFEDALLRKMSESFWRTEDIARTLKLSRASTHRMLQRLGLSDRSKLVETGHLLPLRERGKKNV